MYVVYQIEFIEYFRAVNIIVFWHHESHIIFVFVDFHLFSETGSFLINTDFKLNFTFL